MKESEFRIDNIKEANKNTEHVIEKQIDKNKVKTWKSVHLCEKV